jgi:hypothetical protein
MVVEAPTPVRVQPVPSPDTRAIPSGDGIGQDRALLRRTMGSDYDTESSAVARILSQSPGLRTGGARDPDVITDLVAVRTYLSAGNAEMDNAIRAGASGAHLALARCAAMGLTRLPSFRGAAALRTTLCEEQWRWYTPDQVIVDWGFVGARTRGPQDLAGNADFLIWSMTGRRIDLLESVVPELILFPPGTTFRVLAVRDGEHRAVLLRELAAAEIRQGVVAARSPLDQMALDGLERAEVGWLYCEPAARRPAGPDMRFDGPPGLVATGAIATAETP